MRLLSWNVKGINAPDKWCLIKHQIDETKGDVWLLQEIKWHQDKIDKRLRSWKQWNGLIRQSDGASGRLGIL